MKKFLISSAGIVVILIFAVGYGHLYGLKNLSGYELNNFATVETNQYSTNLDRGRHLSTISGCNGCHGGNYQGMDFINEAPIGYVPAPNLTSAGPVANYTDDDWVKAIRHGIAKDGRVMVAMPSYHYSAYGDDDLAELIAYLKQIPAVEDKFRKRAFNFLDPLFLEFWHMIHGQQIKYLMTKLVEKWLRLLMNQSIMENT